MNTRISSVSVAQQSAAMPAPSNSQSASPQVEPSVPKVEIQVNTEVMKKKLRGCHQPP